MTKRIISVLLALVLVLALAMPAMATEATTTNTITIKDEAGRSFVAYQIFTGRVEGTDTAAILSDIQWGDDVTDAGKTTMGDAETKAKAVGTANDAKAFAVEVKPYVTGGTPAVWTEEGYVFTLEPGYYLIEETTVLADGQVASSYIVELLEADKTMNPKRSGVPDYEKSIVLSEDQKVNMSKNEIGDTVKFEITATVPNGYLEFETYELTFHDTMAPGLTLNPESIKVNCAKELPAPKTELADGETLTYSWEDLTVKDNLAGETITITYTATVNSAAKKGVEGNPNAYKLEYTNAPGKTVETTPKTVYVFTFDLNGVKVDGEGENLGGAIFVLKNENDEYYAYADGDVSWGTKDAATPKTSGTDGKFVFEGLEPGVYYLEETKAPAGYNSLTDPIKVEIKVTENGTVVTAVETITYDAENNATSADAVTVINNMGTTLPETGGIGTTIFYLVGGLMMAAAVVLLVAKKRTVNE